MGVPDQALGWMGDQAHVPQQQWLFQKNLQIMLNRCPSACKCVRLQRTVNNRQSTDNEGASRNEKEEDQKVVATLLWIPIEHQEIDIMTMLQYGMYQLPFRFGWSSLQRLLGTLDEFKLAWKELMTPTSGCASACVSCDNGDATTTSSFSSSNCISLERMTVLPEYQGQGIGGEAIRQLLAKADDDVVAGASPPLIRLATQEARNVVFYERLGFRVIGQCQFGDRTSTNEGDSYPSWFMVREAKTNNTTTRTATDTNTPLAAAPDST